MANYLSKALKISHIKPSVADNISAEYNDLVLKSWQRTNDERADWRAGCRSD